MKHDDVALTTDVKSSEDETIGTWLEAFITDRKVQGKSEKTILYYKSELKKFLSYMDSQAITNIQSIQPNNLRFFLIYLKEIRKQNNGGINAAYRAVKVFMFWYEEEVEPDNWKNPIRKVKAPSPDNTPLEPVKKEVVQMLLSRCENTFVGRRNYALLLALMDSGARANELLSIEIKDVNLINGSMLIRKGKGKKPRTVYLGQKARKSVRAYLKMRSDDNPFLWVTDDFEKLSYEGLRAMIIRLSNSAEVVPPMPHDFRRAFALTMLRNGTDIITLSRLMGHSSISILARYLKQTGEDLETAFRKASPVDTNLN